MTSTEQTSLASKIARADVHDTGARIDLCHSIQALRYHLDQVPELDLIGHLDTAVQLMGLLDRTVGTDPEHIIQCVADLVGTVEEKIQARAETESRTPGFTGLEHLGERNLRSLHDMVLGEILVQLDIVAAGDVERALAMQAEEGNLLGAILVELGAATEAQVQAALHIQSQLRNEMGAPGDLFSAIVPCHPLWKHDFLERAREASVSAAQIKVLATQMYRFCREFNRILAATLVSCPDESARVVIAANLFDELGEGNELRTHPELFRRFTRALGISDEELEATPIEPETQHLIDTYMGLGKKYGYLASLGAICYASENIVGTLYRILLSGIQTGVRVAKEDLVFFHMHVELDCEHAEALIRVVNRGVQDVETAKKVVLAIREALAARVRFFDGIERCMQGVGPAR